MGQKEAEMDKVVTAALAKELEKLATSGRNSLPVGKHTVDATVTLHVEGRVTVSADGDYLPTTSIPLKATLALFMRYAGVTGPLAMDALIKAMSEAITLDEEAVALLAEVADLDAAEAKVRAGLDALPRKPRKGNVTVKVAVTEVAEAANDAAVESVRLVG